MTIFDRIEYDAWLETLIGNRAADLGKTECQRCGFCCAMRPCIPTPDELKAIAKYLGMTLKQCVFTYFVVENLPQYDIDFIFPAKETQLDLVGKGVPPDRSWDKGYCIFYDKKEKKCKIYEVRPKHAAGHRCWEKPEDDPTEEVMAAWKDVHLPDYIQSEGRDDNL